MLSVVSLAKPVARAVQGSNRVGKWVRVVCKPRRTLKSLYAKPCSASRFMRFYSHVHENGDAQSAGIMTVDKWGVQREASEMAKSTEAESEPSSHLPATEMPIFDISRLNFQETLDSKAPVIIMAYLPRCVVVGWRGAHFSLLWALQRLSRLDTLM